MHRGLKTFGRRQFLLWAAAVAGALVPARRAFPETGSLAAFAKIADDATAGYGRQAAIAVDWQGRLVLAHGAGMPAGEPVVLASLSKAITALAIARLVTQGRFGFTTPLSDVLSAFLAKRDAPADARLPLVTVGQLLGHTAGLAPNDRSDPTWGQQIRPLLARYGAEHRIPRHEIAGNVLRFPLVGVPGATHAYSNAGYMLLAQIVEEVSGQPYEAFCRAEVLARAGITGAAVDPQFAWRDGVGGWRMNLPQYLAFAGMFESRPAALFGAAVVEALAKDSAVVNAERKITYLLGMYRRPGAANRSVWWHSGQHLGPAGRKCLFVRSDLGASWIIWGAPGDGNTLAWDKESWAAARATKQWPVGNRYGEFLNAG